MDFLKYYFESSRIRDIDPANDCLKYICDRFELTMEQRYWLAFLYSTCYCAPTVYYLYNDFPDFENVNTARLQRWWNANKHKTVFQSDRLRIKTGNKFVESFESYRDFIGNRTQKERFDLLRVGTLTDNYDAAFKEVGKIKNVGRFTLFIYLEMVSVLTDFKSEPTGIDWANADACRRGLGFAIGREDCKDYPLLDKALEDYLERIKKTGCEHNNIFNIETVLCAYKKYILGRRYIGYYIDRQGREIEKIKSLVTEGVAWRVLDEFRAETYEYLKQPYKAIKQGNLFY